MILGSFVTRYTHSGIEIRISRLKCADIEKTLIKKKMFFRILDGIYEPDKVY